MKKIILFLLMPAFLSFSIVENESKEQPNKRNPSSIIPESEKLQTFLSITDTLMKKTNTPGMGLAIVYENETIYTGGKGFRNVEKKLPVTENTLFAIGSCTKLFTGFLAAKLVEADKLDWNNRIIQHLPDFQLSSQYVTDNVTVQDAFTHVTGLGRHDGLWKGKPLSRNGIYNELKHLSFSGSLRERWEYNNLMYLVMGLLTERIAEKSWEEQIQQEIFKPLKMKESYTKYDEFMAHEEKSVGYNVLGRQPMAHENVDNIGPAGSITSTPRDIAKWLKMLVNQGQYEGKSMISTAQYDYLTTPKSMSLKDACTVKYYSVGLGGTMENGKRKLGHSGGIDGQSCVMSIQPDDGFGVFILMNYHSDVKYLLDQYAKEIFLESKLTRDFAKEAELETGIRAGLFYADLVDNFKKNEESVAYENCEVIAQKYPELPLEEVMNAIGYNEFLVIRNYKKALSVFKYNVEKFPNSANAYDSYGEALAKAGETEKAIKMYEKSLELNPKNEGGKAALKRLKAGK